jgi:hypothetical protein
MIKNEKMEVHVAPNEEIRNVYRILIRIMRGRKLVEALGVNGRICAGFVWPWIRTSGGLF